MRLSTRIGSHVDNGDPLFIVDEPRSPIAVNSSFVSFHSPNELDLCGRSSDIVALPNGAGFTLRGSVLIADEQACILFRKSEELSRFVWAKNELGSCLEQVQEMWYDPRYGLSNRRPVR